MNKEFLSAAGQSESLVMKGGDKIASIVSRYSEDAHVSLATWQIGRVFRRDFNLMTYKMFKSLAAKKRVDRIEYRMMELQLVLDSVQQLAADYPVPQAEKIQHLEVRLVSTEARRLFDMLSAMDVVMSQLLAQYDINETAEKCAAFFAAYGRLKQTLFQKDDAVIKEVAVPEGSLTVPEEVIGRSWRRIKKAQLETQREPSSARKLLNMLSFLVQRRK